MPRRCQDTHHVHPLQDLACPDVAVLVSDLGRHPLVQVHFGSWARLLFVVDHCSLLVPPVVGSAIAAPSGASVPRIGAFGAARDDNVEHQPRSDILVLQR